jgi:hypothetical protein
MTVRMMKITPDEVPCFLAVEGALQACLHGSGRPVFNFLAHDGFKSPAL